MEAREPRGCLKSADELRAEPPVAGRTIARTLPQGAPDEVRLPTGVLDACAAAVPAGPNAQPPSACYSIADWTAATNLSSDMLRPQIATATF